MFKLQQQKSIVDKITIIYGAQGNDLLVKIKQLLIKYKSFEKPDNKSLTEKDIVLITYGDSVLKKGQKPLETLKYFVDTYVLPEINSTHILPFYPYTSDDGFSVVDYVKVNPDLGTWDDISALAKSSNLMFDAVINHISKSSDWFKGYLAGDPSLKEFFIDVNPKKDLSKVIRPRALPLLTPFIDEEGKKHHIWSTFSDDQLDLNYKSPAVFLAILEVLLIYVQKGAKLIRLDAIAFLWKEIGTDCLHLSKTHEVIKLYREILASVNPNLVLITETNVPHNENISYFGNGYDEAHLVYNFSLAPLLVYSMMEKNTDILTNWVQSLQTPSDKVCFFNFTASHDGIGIRPLQGIISDEEIQKLVDRTIDHGGYVSFKNNSDGTQSPYELNCNLSDLISKHEESKSNRVNKFLLTQAIMLAMPGVPGIYIHSLLGSQNYIKGVKESGIKRRINREKLDLDLLEIALNDTGSFRYQVYNKYKKILQLRTQEKAFNPYGKVKYTNLGNEKLFIIEREFNKEIIYAIFNFSNEQIQIDALTNKSFDLLSNKKIINSKWILDGYSFKWFKKSSFQ